MFRKPIDRAMQGDRIGLCVTQFDPDKLERGLICKSSMKGIWSISFFGFLSDTRSDQNLSWFNRSSEQSATFQTWDRKSNEVSYYLWSFYCNGQNSSLRRSFRERQCCQWFGVVRFRQRIRSTRSISNRWFQCVRMSSNRIVRLTSNKDRPL